MRVKSAECSAGQVRWSPSRCVYHGKRRIEYLPYDGFGDLHVPEVRLIEIEGGQWPKIASPSAEEIYAVCLLICGAELPELGLEIAAEKFPDAARYVEAHFATERESEKAAQFMRRRTREGKARFFMTALLNPELTPTSAYAKATASRHSRAPKRFLTHQRLDSN